MKYIILCFLKRTKFINSAKLLLRECGIVFQNYKTNSCKAISPFSLFSFIEGQINSDYKYMWLSRRGLKYHSQISMKIQQISCLVSQVFFSSLFLFELTRAIVLFLFFMVMIMSFLKAINACKMARNILNKRISLFICTKGIDVIVEKLTQYTFQNIMFAQKERYPKVHHLIFYFLIQIIFFCFKGVLPGRASGRRHFLRSWPCITANGKTFLWSSPCIIANSRRDFLCSWPCITANSRKYFHWCSRASANSKKHSFAVYPVLNQTAEGIFFAVDPAL